MAKRNGAVDFAYLQSFAAGDQSIVDHILVLFRGQAEGWLEHFATSPGEWREVVHTIKGTSRGVGAMALGDACERAERDGDGALGPVIKELAAAIADIAAYQEGER